MRAVVTGAAGFAGTWLCRHLVSHGVSVTGWVRAAPGVPVDLVKYKVQDVTDRAGCQATMKADSPDVVFHLAAMTHVKSCQDDPEQANSVNVVGTENVLRSMAASARAVVVSSCHVYGGSTSEPISEDHAVNPKSVYAASKLAAERVALDTGRHVVIARAFHHTGPGQSAEFVLSDWAHQVRSGVAEVAVGNLSLRRDFTDVRDIVAGYALLAMSGQPGEIYNLCSGRSERLQTFFDWMSEGTDVVAVPVPARFRENDNPVLTGNPSKAEALGWSRVHDLRSTLGQMARA